MENMHAEICRLRERIATLEGRESVLSDMLKGTQEEIPSIKEEMQQLKIILIVCRIFF